MLGWAIAVSMSAFAQEASLVPMDGSPLPGEHVSLLVAVADASGTPLDLKDPPTLEAERGSVLRLEGPLSKGLWSYLYRAPRDGKQDELAIVYGSNVERRTLTIGMLEGATLEVPATVVGRAGENETLTFVVTGPELPPPDRLQVRASEGQVVGIVPQANGLAVTWQPDPERFPRSVPIGIRDSRRPRVAPVWTIAQLHSTATISDRTEPDTQVRIRVGGRTYGPVTADAQGRAGVTVEVRPGEREGEIERIDRAGNVGRSPISLGGKAQPAITLLVESELLAGQRAPLLHLAATKAGGDAWEGEAPVCRTSLGEAASVVPTMQGRYLVLLPRPPENVFFDLRVDCSIGTQVLDSLRIPVASAQPSRLVVRPYPPEVSADFPVAQVQAFLENGLGDRLPAAGIRLTADKGEVIQDPSEPATIRGEYRGYRAAPQGKDVLRASWDTPSGDGPLWALELSATATHEVIHLHGRAIDSGGRPLRDKELVLTVLGHSGTVRTGERGWATATVPADASKGPWAVSVESGGIVRRALLFPGTTLGRDPTRADLETAVEVPILAGRIREVAIWTDPKTLTSGGETARVHVRLTDRAGNAVTDEEISLEASTGAITTPKQRPDGTFEATFAPPTNLQQGTVRITVTGQSSEIKTSTEIEIRPRDVTFAPGLHAGYLLGPPNLYAPWIGLQFDNKLSRASDIPIFLRFTTGLFVASTEIDAEDLSAEPIVETASVLHLGAGALYRWDWVRRAAWLGSGVVVAPFRASQTFDDRLIDGFGLALPGFSVNTGYGWRIGGGELELEATYMFLMLMDGYGWNNFSGVVTTVGYKVLY